MARAVFKAISPERGATSWKRRRVICAPEFRQPVPQQSFRCRQQHRLLIRDVVDHVAHQLEETFVVAGVPGSIARSVPISRRISSCSGRDLPSTSLPSSTCRIAG